MSGRKAECPTADRIASAGDGTDGILRDAYLNGNPWLSGNINLLGQASVHTNHAQKLRRPAAVTSERFGTP